MGTEREGDQEIGKETAHRGETEIAMGGIEIGTVKIEIMIDDIDRGRKIKKEGILVKFVVSLLHAHICFSYVYTIYI